MTGKYQKNNVPHGFNFYEPTTQSDKTFLLFDFWAGVGRIYKLNRVIYNSRS
jgi:hypothetical protein